MSNQQEIGIRRHSAVSAMRRRPPCLCPNAKLSGQRSEEICRASGGHDALDRDSFIEGKTAKELVTVVKVEQQRMGGSINEVIWCNCGGQTAAVDTQAMGSVKHKNTLQTTRWIFTIKQERKQMNRLI